MRFLTAGNKISIYVSPKCGSRTITALTALSYVPDLIDTNPDYFTEKGFVKRGDYSHLLSVIHQHLPSFKWHEIEAICTDIRVAVKRDPLKRFISGYTNRILWHHDLPYREHPSFDQFIDNFDHYNHHPKDYEKQVQKHFHLQRVTIGRYPSVYTHIIDTCDMEKLFQLFEEVYNRDFPRLRLQQGGNELQKDIEITDNHRQWVRKRYEDDYDIWFPDLLL